MFNIVEKKNMKINNYREKKLVISAVSLIIIVSIPVFTNTTPASDLYNSEECQTSSIKITNFFRNSIIFVSGSCNRVTGPLMWIFGFYCPLLKRGFLITALGKEGEKINVVIKGEKYATYYDIENINIQIRRANGILFWGGKSLLVNNTRIFALCKAAEVWITTYD